MKAYKATKNMMDVLFTFEVGKTYEIKGNIKICTSGFHFCKKFNDVDEIYTLSDQDTIVLEIKVFKKDIVVSKDGKTSVSDKIKVLRVVPREEYPILSNGSIDNRGNVLRKEWSTGNWETWEYDKNNKKIKYEKSNGYWEKLEYDKNSNKIKYETSSGLWKIWEYDKNNKITKVEYSNGDLETWKYDKNKNIIDYKSNKINYHINIS